MQQVVAQPIEDEHGQACERWGAKRGAPLRTSSGGAERIITKDRAARKSHVQLAVLVKALVAADPPVWVSEVDLV